MNLSYTSAIAFVPGQNDWMFFAELRPDETLSMLVDGAQDFGIKYL